MSFKTIEDIFLAKTRHSISELLASLLAPCTPVEATSPTAYNPFLVEEAFKSVLTPPIQ